MLRPKPLRSRTTLTRFARTSSLLYQVWDASLYPRVHSIAATVFSGLGLFSSFWPAWYAAAPRCSIGLGTRRGSGHRGRSGSPNAVLMFSIFSVESRMWLGAGKR
jgi:hypothetical protein